MAQTVNLLALRANERLKKIVRQARWIPGTISRDQTTRLHSAWQMSRVLAALAAKVSQPLLPLRSMLQAGARSFASLFLSEVEKTRAVPRTTPLKPEYDLVFFLPEKSRGWILEAICREIGRELRASHAFHFRYDRLPRARAYFVAHYSVLDRLIATNPQVLESDLFLFFTHPREDMVYPMTFHARMMAVADRVLVMNEGSRGLLSSLGVPREKMEVIMRAADPLKFLPHERTGLGKVGFCTAFYERKRPELILDLVRLLPHRRFLLMGKGWREWSRFEELAALPNFEYREPSYDEYPALYAQMDVFVSPAILEGGPFPLLETMMCNVVPVASRTGFAPDFIRNAENGFLFHVDAPASEVALLVDKAFSIKTDVGTGVRHLTWPHLANRVDELLEEVS